MAMQAPPPPQQPGCHTCPGHSDGLGTDTIQFLCSSDHAPYGELPDSYTVRIQGQTFESASVTFLTFYDNLPELLKNK